MHKLALVGRDISHSKSKSIYEEILNKIVDYVLFDFDDPSFIPTLDEIFDKGLEGLSITAPYKSHFISEVTIENSIIKNLNTINCIKKTNKGYFATNTDYLAVRDILDKKLKSDMSVVILGNGKMAKVCAEILKEKCRDYKQFSRELDGDISLVDFGSTEKMFIINSCSRDFVYRGRMSSHSYFWDLNYSHELHEKSIHKVCRYEDGLELLRLQGKYAVKFWELS